MFRQHLARRGENRETSARLVLASPRMARDDAVLTIEFDDSELVEFEYLIDQLPYLLAQARYPVESNSDANEHGLARLQYEKMIERGVMNGELAVREKLTLQPLPAYACNNGVVRVAELTAFLKQNGVSVKFSSESDEQAPLKTGTQKRWTEENLAELRQYRRDHGTKAAAAHFGISESRVRQKLPGAKPQKKARPFDGLGKR